jgi:hypothetical protein
VFKTTKEWEGRELLGSDSEAEGYKPFTFTCKGEAILEDNDGRTKVQMYPIAPRQQHEAVQRKLAMLGGVVEKLDLSQPAEPEPELLGPSGSLLGPFEGEPDPRLKLLHDVIAVATPTAEQIAADPLCEFVVQTDPLVELLRKHSSEYKGLTSSDLRKRMEGFGLRSHQKNYDDGVTKASRRGWWLSEINNVIYNQGEN